MVKNDFKPYISEKQTPSEFTVTAVAVGTILAIVFGAANAYLGLRVGLTVSASIPAAVVSMGVLRAILHRNSILESNIVQTIGSAGESLAAGTIFTLPVLFLWAAEGKLNKPGMFEITLIALIGGLLGVFFMIPLRKALVVKEHGILPYPEGTACAEVLLAGEQGGSKASVVFSGMGIASLLKFVVDGLKLASGEISVSIKGYAGQIGTQIYPAVLSVGYICGAKISSYMFSGGVLSWLVIIPMIVLFGKDSVLYPGIITIGEIYTSGGASSIWSTYIRYIGAGTLAAGGIISLFKSLPLIVTTFSGSAKFFSVEKKEKQERTSREIHIKIVLVAILILTVLVWLVPAIPVSFLGAVLIVVFGFLFATVSSRMVGLVGSSNNPVSGMAIATLLIATLILKVTDATGIAGMSSAIAIGSVICIVSAIAGDTSQDLKTGYILGATPKKQQIGEIIGVLASALTIGATLYILDNAWGFGTEELAAPQSTLMKLIIEGVMEGNLPWSLVFFGVFIAISAEIVGIPVLPFAIGVYLPVQLSACIMIGGLIRFAIENINKKRKEKDEIVNNGILYCSGMIAGEGITGIILALLSIFGFQNFIDISARIGVSNYVKHIGGIVVLVTTIYTVFLFSKQRKRVK